MTAIQSLELFAVDLPFKNPFKHAAAERISSDSLFLKCTTDDGNIGFGETLPREYVTGESRDGSFDMLHTLILPKLLGHDFASMDEVRTFLEDCNGKAPTHWVNPELPQTAAWCAVDLVLLDAFGHAFGEAAFAPDARWPDGLRYSGVLSSYRGFKLFRSAFKQRLYGIKACKLKVDDNTDESSLRMARRGLGRRCDLRVDANMAWDVDTALGEMAMMARHGVQSFEQPLPAEDLEGLSRLVAATDLGVMADESISDAASLQRLIEMSACTAINVRIAKCGGLIAAANRCRVGLDAGLTIQIGCQVGESSLLSAAHLALVASVGTVRYAEGCFGRHLLREDPASPLLQFGHGGKPPNRPTGAGLGVKVDEKMLREHTVRAATIVETGEPS